jgi:hypothetical protein
MKFTPCLSGLLLLLGVATAQAQPQPDHGRGSPIRVMSDTPEFCANLADHFAEVSATHPTVPPSSVKLAREGQRMCAAGLVRAGIERLRLAFFGVPPEPPDQMTSR